MVSFSLPIVGVDTLKDLKIAEQLMEKDELFPKYGKGKYEHIH